MIILVGASASGKTVVAKLLASKYGIGKAITHTTRNKREGEVNGVDYFFVTKNEFLAMERMDQFVETTWYNGNFYGCSKAQVADDKCVVVDPAGLQHFLDLDSKRIIAFYLDADEETRRLRMEGRGDKEEDILKRIENDRLVFNEEVKEKCRCVVKVEGKTIDELTDFIATQYQKILAELN